MKRLVLVDGNALLHRAYHATPPLTAPTGELVNAVYGFTSMLLRSITELTPDFIAVAWDERSPTFRHQAYTQYKATRGPTDDGLGQQYKRVHELVKSLNIPEFSVAGYEADDLIGTLAMQAVGKNEHSSSRKNKNIEVIILTGDRDIMQIIDKNIKILMPKKTIQDVGLYGIQEFIDRFGFEPKLLVDYKALAGDLSDNIPGVAGIGAVTATKLVKQFSTVEKIYKKENLKTLPERTQLLLAEGAESAVMSKQLATLELNAPIQLDLSLCVTHDFNKEKTVSLFEELGFKSLISRIPGNTSNGTNEPENIQPVRNMPERIIQLDLEVEKVLEQMSKNGVLIDVKFLEKMSITLREKLIEIETEIYKHVGHEFNINSPKQLGDILFDELHLPVVKKTKTGRSTDEATLTELSTAHPVIPFILQYRQIFKLMSTYIDALPKYVKEDGRVHSTFNVEGAATGRLSSTNPNMQNIPIKGEMGGEIRKAFIAPKGSILLAADYSQIELRIMAHMSGDEKLIESFKKGLDIHATTASKIFDIPIEEVNKGQRMVGKTMNFATLYGQGPHALSKQLGIDFQVARQYIEEYFAQFSKVKEWMGNVLAGAYQTGYVETIWGRKRYIPELQSSNRMLKAFGERAAINHPIQGSSADMIKKAMIDIDKELKTNSCRLILQIHDELLFECVGDVDSQSIKDLAKLVKEKMESSLHLDVPVVVDIKVGCNWGEMNKFDV